MLRWLRLAFALLVAVLVASASSAAYAIERPPPEIGPVDERGAPAKDVRPTLIVPHDVPVVLPTTHLTIPPLPPSYVTKDLGWLELAYPANAQERVAGILADADAIKAELVAEFDQPILQHVTVRIAPTFADMARLAPADAPPPEYAAGVAYHGMHLVLVSMLAPRGAEAVDVDEVFRHELSHVAIEDATLGQHVPVWFNEGLAIRLSGELSYARTKTLWSATLSDTLIPLADLDKRFPRDNFDVSIAYAESADFMRFLTRKSDHLRFAAMIGRVREGQAFDSAIAEAYGADLRRLELEWRRDVEHRYSVIPVLTGGGLVWMLVLGILVAAYVRRRRRTKTILARWEREEALEDARLAKIAADEREIAMPIAAVASAAKANAVSVKVEHLGRWHTLH